MQWRPPKNLKIFKGAVFDVALTPTAASSFGRGLGCVDVEEQGQDQGHCGRDHNQRCRPHRFLGLGVSLFCQACLLLVSVQNSNYLELEFKKKFITKTSLR